MRKSNIISFILGAVVLGTISTVFAYTLFANNVGYEPQDEAWEVDNVKSAIDDLHHRIKTIDDYVHKPYTQEGLSIYDNRVTILSGGYYTDPNGTVWVNLKFKMNKTLNGDDCWLLIYGLPSNNNEKALTDINNIHSFKFNSKYVSHPKSNISFMDFSQTSLQENEEITIQFKY